MHICWNALSLIPVEYMFFCKMPTTTSVRVRFPLSAFFVPIFSRRLFSVFVGMCGVRMHIYWNALSLIPVEYMFFCKMPTTTSVRVRFPLSAFFVPIFSRRLFSVFVGMCGVRFLSSVCSFTNLVLTTSYLT